MLPEPQTCRQTTPAPSQPSHTDVPAEKRSAPVLSPQTHAWRPGVSFVTTNKVITPTCPLQLSNTPSYPRVGPRRSARWGGKCGFSHPFIQGQNVACPAAETMSLRPGSSLTAPCHSSPSPWPQFPLLPSLPSRAPCIMVTSARGGLSLSDPGDLM